MKKYQWIPGTLVFCTPLNVVGKILDMEEPTIENNLGGELAVEDLTTCRYATEAEALAFEETVGTEATETENHAGN